MTKVFRTEWRINYRPTGNRALISRDRCQRFHRKGANFYDPKSQHFHRNRGVLEPKNPRKG